MVFPFWGQSGALKALLFEALNFKFWLAIDVLVLPELPSSKSTVSFAFRSLKIHVKFGKDNWKRPRCHYLPLEGQSILLTAKNVCGTSIYIWNSAMNLKCKKIRRHQVIYTAIIRDSKFLQIGKKNWCATQPANCATQPKTHVAHVHLVVSM